MLKRGTRIWRRRDNHPGRVIRVHRNDDDGKHYGIVYRIRWWEADEYGQLHQQTCGKTLGDFLDSRGSWRLTKIGERKGD